MVTDPAPSPFITVESGWPTAARKDLRGRLVACNEHGERIGQDHQNAKLSDAQVEAIRDRYDVMKEAHEAGGPRVSLKPMAAEFGVHLNTVKSVVYFRRRNVFPSRWKRIDN